MRLIHEIHRRSLWQVLSVYLVSSWVTLTVADTVTAALGLPDWVPRAALVLLIVLLPVVLATAFVQEGVGEARPEAAPEAQEAEGEPTPEIPPPGMPLAEPRSAHHRVFTWRNAITAAVVMLALLTVSAGGYMGLRAAGVGPFGTLMSKGVLEERDRIVLAEFANRTPDSLLAIAATQLFRTALSQSATVNVAGQQYVAGVLLRMGSDPSTTVSYDVAREVAIREGLKAVVAGEIISMGVGFVVSARLVAPQSGEILWTDSETARDSTALIGATDALSRMLRERIGESLRTIRASDPLEAVTTGSLDALRKYSQAERALESFDHDKGIALLEEAIALDTTFAMAWRKLGIALGNVAEQRAREVEALTKAYDYRDHLTDRERYLTVATYHKSVSGQYDRATTAYRTLLDIYPDEATALNNLAVILESRGDHEGAEEMARRALAVDSSSYSHHVNLLIALIGQRRFEETAAGLERMDRTFPDNPWLNFFRAGLAYARGDYTAAEESLRNLAEDNSSQSSMPRIAGHEVIAAVAATRGRLRLAESHVRQAVAALRARNLLGESLSDLAFHFGGEAFLLGGSDRALALIDEALELYPLDSLPELNRPYLDLARFFAMAGLPERAQEMIAEYERIDPALRQSSEPDLQATRGIIECVLGNYEEGIRQLRLSQTAQQLCPFCWLPSLARAYDLAGQPDAAVAAYERYVMEPSFFRMGSDAFELGPTYERLAALHEGRGDTAKAIYYYGKLAELWKDADPELQPRVEAARRAIEALSPDA
jgi:tetratricopeptide (TPR) repeat protein